MQRPAQRVGVFVDVQNMYYSARALFDQRVDFGEILKEAVGDRQLIRAIAYVIRADKEEEEKFFDALVERGYELRGKDLLRFYGGNEKGDWDIGIAMDVVKMCEKLDAVVIVSGDGDFADLLEYVKSRGCQAEVMAFGSSASSQLREAADAVFDLSQNTKRFLIPGKRGSRNNNNNRGGNNNSNGSGKVPVKGNRPDPGLPQIALAPREQQGGQKQGARGDARTDARETAKKPATKTDTPKKKPAARRGRGRSRKTATTPKKSSPKTTTTEKK